MAQPLRACLIGCGRMGATIDDEVLGRPDIPLPYSHAAAYVAADETELVAVADVDEGKVAAICERYGVSRGYSDYREMIERERPDIVSIATRPATHREMSEFAAARGVPGIYCEKPLCCSMEEADAMRAAVERAGVRFNLGVNRRYQPLFHRMRALADAGELGEIRAIIGHCGAGSALWSLTHASDMLMYLAGDPEVLWAQGTAEVDPADFADNRVEIDPRIPMGYFQFANGVDGILAPTPGFCFEVSGTEGHLRTYNNGYECVWRRQQGPWGHFSPVPFPEVPQQSGSLNGIRDLARAILEGRETLGNIRLACRSHEMMLALIESERQRGARVSLPMENRSLYVGKGDW